MNKEQAMVKAAEKHTKRVAHRPESVVMSLSLEQVELMRRVLHEARRNDAEILGADREEEEMNQLLSGNITLLTDIIAQL